MESTTKYDDDKPRFSLVPMECLEEVAKVFTFGAKKYGDFNWRTDLGTSRHHEMRRRFLDAAFRHLVAGAIEPIDDHWLTEGIDEDSGVHHFVHAMVNLMFLYTYDTHNPNTGMKKYKLNVFDDATRQEIREKFNSQKKK